MSTRKRMPPAVVEALDPLTDNEQVFVLRYFSNGYSATEAYQHAYQCSHESAGTQGPLLMRRPRVQAAVRTVRAHLADEHYMGVDEATALTAMRARADVSLAFNADGTLRKPWEWPLTLRVAVKSLKPDGTIVLHDAQKATDTILMMHGALRQSLDVTVFDHGAYLIERQLAAEGRLNGPQRALSPAPGPEQAPVEEDAAAPAPAARPAKAHAGQARPGGRRRGPGRRPRPTGKR